MLTLGKRADGIDVEATAVAVRGAWFTYCLAWIVVTTAMDASGARSAAFLSARDLSGRAAEFLTVTCAVATCVVATDGAGGAALGTAFRTSRANTFAVARNLIARAMNRLRSRGWPSRSFDVARQLIPNDRYATKSERGFDSGSAGNSAAK